ncbi:MAG: adenosylmethionine decarboxylase [Nitrospiraceae bacterium]|nr:MAG: adenosylmethionine decarboxylase [Nitrospiraceae bacterium]
MHALGRHLVLELNGCNPKLLGDVKRVEDIMVAAAKIAKATIVGVHFHQFSPFGVSGVVVIAESHVAIHTWPEHAYAAVDIFTCGETLNSELAAQYLVEKFQSRQPSLMELKRGLIPDSQPAKVSGKVTKEAKEVFAYGRPKELQVVS